MFSRNGEFETMAFEKLQEILSEILGIDKHQIRSEKELVKDFCADSFLLFQILIRLEATFGIMIQEGELQNWRTVGDIWQYLQIGRKDMGK